MELATAVYKPSGKLGTALVLVPVAGLVSALVLGIAYGFINVYNPLIYIEVLATFFFGLLIGIAVAHTAVFAKCRNPAFAALMGAVCGAAGLYFGWAVFIFALIQRYGGVQGPTLVDCLINPLQDWNFVANTLAPNGWFTLFGATPSGVLLWAIWCAEAAIIVGASGFYAYTTIEEKVFCETCAGWCALKKDVARADGKKDLTLLPRLQAGDLAAMNELPPPKPGAASYFRLDHQLCEKCGNMGTYKLFEVTEGKDKDGKTETKEKELTGHMLLSAESAQQLGPLLARGKFLKAAAPAAGDAAGSQFPGPQAPGAPLPPKEKS
ncbi:MAG: hypothetical protein HY291_14355 [Planctomycetes bacterium]|nr:hypothetical protein [Planctomycetota bacterium]